MTGEWQVTSNILDGNTVCGIFRYRDSSGSMDIYGECFDDQNEAQKICGYLNIISNTAKHLAGHISLKTYTFKLHAEWRNNPHMLEAIWQITKKYI